jgi:hypothetical protein
LKTLPRGTAILQGGGDQAADGGGVGGRRGDWRRQGREEGTKMEVAYRVFQLNHIKRKWGYPTKPACSTLRARYRVVLPALGGSAHHLRW